MGQRLMALEVLPDTPNRNRESRLGLGGDLLPGRKLLRPGLRRCRIVAGLDEPGDEESRIDCRVGVS